MKVNAEYLIAYRIRLCHRNKRYFVNGERVSRDFYLKLKKLIGVK